MKDMTDFSHILNWKLKEGSHGFPGPDGGTCINEAAIVAAGFPYQEVLSVEDMPLCFSRVISTYALFLNDGMPDKERQRLIPYVIRLSGTADSLEVERVRAEFLAMYAVNTFLSKVLDEKGFHTYASVCREAHNLSEAKTISLAVYDRTITARYASRAISYAESAMQIEPARQSALAAKSSALETNSWDNAIDALDGVLAIGRKSDAIPITTAAERLDRVRVRV
jgi:hypothetical protein